MVEIRVCRLESSCQVPWIRCLHVEKGKRKKEHVWWEVQIAGAMIELLFGSGGLVLDADTDT